MAVELRGFTISLKANEAIDQYLITKVDKDFGCSKATVDDTVAGIIQNDPKEGQAGAIMVSGISKVKVAEALKAGDLVAANANGEAVKATGKYFGIALADASAGAIGSVLIGFHNGTV